MEDDSHTVVADNHTAAGRQVADTVAVDRVVDTGAADKAAGSLEPVEHIVAAQVAVVQRALLPRAPR